MCLACAGSGKSRKLAYRIARILLENVSSLGLIALLLFEDVEGNILGAEIVDFKTVEGGEEPTTIVELEWTEFALQVQLYARATE